MSSVLCDGQNIEPLSRISFWFFPNNATIKVKYKIIAFYVEDIYFLLYGVKPKLDTVTSFRLRYLRAVGK